MTDKNIWYLPGPFHRYEDDVKALAKKAGLRIVDASVTESRDGEADKVPTVKLKEVPASLVIEVTLSQAETELKEAVDKLGAERDGLVRLVESVEQGLPLEHPGAGELPIRLFDALTKIHAGIQDLRSAHDELSLKRDYLVGEVDSLKKAEADRVEKAVKAKPEAGDKK